MSRSWSLLFSTVQLLLIPRATDPSEDQDAVTVGSHALKEAARLLAEAMLNQHPDADLMWGYWADLRPTHGNERYSQSRGGRDGTTHLARIHGHLTIVLTSYLLSVASNDADRSFSQVWVNEVLRQVLEVGNDGEEFSAMIRTLMDSEESASVAQEFWDQLSRRDLPNRQAVFLPMLHSAVARLLIVRIAFRGRLRPPVGEWVMSFDDTEFDRYWSDAQEIADRAGMVIPSTREDVRVEAEEQRRAGRELEAQRLARGSLSQQRIDNLRSAFAVRLDEERKVGELLGASGANVYRDSEPEQTLTATVSRGFFVDSTNYVGEETIGTGLADQIVREEVGSVLRNWMNQGIRVDSRDLVQEIGRQAPDADRLLLVCPVGWSGDRWREIHLAPYQDLVREYTTNLLRDEILLVSGANQAWHIGERGSGELTVEEVPLEPRATSANVRIKVKYSLPRASGRVRTVRLPVPWDSEDAG